MRDPKRMANSFFFHFYFEIRGLPDSKNGIWNFSIWSFWDSGFAVKSPRLVHSQAVSELFRFLTFLKDKMNSSSLKMEKIVFCRLFLQSKSRGLRCETQNRCEKSAPFLTFGYWCLRIFWSTLMKIKSGFWRAWRTCNFLIFLSFLDLLLSEIRWEGFKIVLFEFSHHRLSKETKMEKIQRWTSTIFSF